MVLEHKTGGINKRDASAALTRLELRLRLDESSLALYCSSIGIMM